MALCAKAPTALWVNQRRRSAWTGEQDEPPQQPPTTIEPRVTARKAGERMVPPRSGVIDVNLAEERNWAVAAADLGLVLSCEPVGLQTLGDSRAEVLDRVTRGRRCHRRRGVRSSRRAPD